MHRRFSVALLVLLTASLAAQTTPAPAAAPAAASTYHDEILKEHDDLEKKLVGLAHAIPAEKYSWRPAEGVRSIGEVYAHLTAANYAFTRNLGVRPPAGLDLRNIEKTMTEKDKIIAALKQSFADARTGIKNTPAADLGKVVKLFGNDSSVRNVLLILCTHNSEHLGQSIAYARSVGVVPPWTAERQAPPAPAKPAETPKK